MRLRTIKESINEAIVTFKTVNAAIKKEFPNIELIKGNGYFYISSDDGSTSSFYETSIPVYRITNLSIDQWLDAVRELMKQAEVNEAVITPPDIPDTMNFWHGGNLDEYDDVIAQKNGKYEYGPGLYITTHYDTARKYSKGSRKFYLVTVENGNDIADATITIDDANAFIDEYVIGSKRKNIKTRLKEYDKGGKIKAYLLNNMILNDKAIKATNTPELRKFFVEHGIDYEIVDNAFGWREKMMVLYNMKKIKQIIQVKPGDKIEEYDLLKKDD